ncbi:hypothetical protein, partial [Micromonospora sp. NPDC005324]|uniref:hypothetical protein n=1 Tax=Micromonospora sp. NPDC005324 TaxID=3157033 RepID=UPI0033B8FBA5
MAHPVRADGDANMAWWAAPPMGRVSHLPGVDPELLRVALDPLPPAAPAIVHYRPTVAGPLGDLVDSLLDQLDTAALAMFPRWLTGADSFDSEGTLGVAGGGGRRGAPPRPPPPPRPGAGRPPPRAA